MRKPPRFFRSTLAPGLLCLGFCLLLLRDRIVPLGALPRADQDCYQSVWNLWFATESISSGRSPYSTSQIFYPIGANLAHHTLSAGFFPVPLLVKLLMRGDPRYPIYSYRILVLLCFCLLLGCSYALLRQLRTSRFASGVAAVSYAFGAFYMHHAIHLNLLAGFFIPLAAWFGVRALERPTRRRAVLAAVVTAASAYCTEFALFLYMAAGLGWALAVAFPAPRNMLAAWRRELGLRNLVLAAGCGVLLLAPLAALVLRDRIIKPGFEESVFYSADLAGFFVPSPGHTPLYGRWFAPLAARITTGIDGAEVFAGFVPLVFGAVGLVTSRRRSVRASAVLAALFFLLSLGPHLQVLGRDTGMPLPGALLARAPLFEASRTPVRCTALALFFTMIVAAAGVGAAEHALLRAGRWRLPALGLVLVWVVAEVYSPAPRQAPFVPPPQLAELVPGPVLDVPPLEKDGYAALLQVFHHQPIATGYVARASTARLQHVRILKRAFDKGGTTFWRAVTELGYRNVVITPESISAPIVPSLAPLELETALVNVVDLRRRPGGAARLRSEGLPARFPPYVLGTRLELGAETARPYLAYGWGDPDTSGRWSVRGKAAVVFAAVATGPARLRLTAAPHLVPGKLERQRVGVELNGRPIAEFDLRQAGFREQVVEIPAGLFAVENVLVFRLPDAESLRSLGSGADVRLLGIEVLRLQIDPAPGAQSPAP